MRFNLMNMKSNSSKIQNQHETENTSKWDWEGTQKVSRISRHCWAVNLTCILNTKYRICPLTDINISSIHAHTNTPSPNKRASDASHYYNPESHPISSAYKLLERQENPSREC